MEIQDKIYAFFEEKKMTDGLDYDTDLSAGGFVNSLFALEIVLYLEKTFGIRLKGRDISKDSFRSINTMAELVRRKLEG